MQFIGDPTVGNQNCELQLRNGKLSFPLATALTNPASGASIQKDTLYAKSLPKAWGVIQAGSTSNPPVLLDGFGVSSTLSFVGGNVRATLEHPMVDDDYVVQVEYIGGGTIIMHHAIVSASQIDFDAVTVTFGSPADIVARSIGTSTDIRFSFVVFGETA
jgi:hypothetical protein